MELEDNAYVTLGGFGGAYRMMYFMYFVRMIARTSDIVFVSKYLIYHRMSTVDVSHDERV